MEAAEYVQMARVQDRHWWFEAKRRTVGALLRRYRVPMAAPGAPTGWRNAHGASRRVLEVGPGTGSMIALMARHGRAIAADAYLPALQLLRDHRRDAASAVPIGANLLDLPFASESFSLLGCFDVLYHQRVVDVADAIAELYRVCEPGGYLAITDSAFPMLRSSHDVATHGARRFRLPDLARPLEAAGFNIEHASYFHALLFPAAAAVRLSRRLVERVSPRPRPPAHSDLAPVPAWLNRLLLGIYRVETPLVVRFRVPFGVSLLILARRPGGGPSRDADMERPR